MSTKPQNFKYIGQKYTFYRDAKENCIGKGGNGEVYNVKCDELKGEFVIKILKYNKKFDERKERFRREIEAMIKINQLYPDKFILSVIDYQLAEKETWYITSKATVLKEYLKANSLTFIAKYQICLQLCEVLKKLHSLGYYHRDIKLDNIFIKGEIILLGDFGLVWNDEYEDLTMIGEAIGPANIKPPECYQGFANAIPNELQYAVDVYEFAKTVWMILKNEKYCFNGQYHSGLKNISIELDDIQQDSRVNIKTLGPLNELLEVATEQDAASRPTMEKVLLQMHEFIKVNRNEQEVKKWQIKESTRMFTNKNKTEIYGYHSVRKIVELLNTIKNSIFLEIDGFQTIVIEECSIFDESASIILIVDKNKNQYILSIETLYINQDDIESNDFRLIVKRYNFSADYREYQSIYQYNMFPGVLIENKKFYVDKDEVVAIRII